MNYPRTVRLADTDAAGVAYFAQILSMCHEAYEASLEEAGISFKALVGNPSLAIPIVHAEVDFFRPLFCGDLILIDLIPQPLSENEFAIAYQIVSASPSQECLAKAKTRHVCINPAIRCRIPLPETILQWLHLSNQIQDKKDL